MSDDLGDLGELRHFEEGVRASLREKADGISPNHRLGAILEADAPAKRRTGPWLISIAAAFVLVAALGLGFMLSNHTQGSAASGAAAPVQKDANTNGEVTPAVASTGADATRTPSSTAATWAMPLYEIVTGTNAHPWLLNRTFVTVPDPGDRVARVQAAITALLPNGAQTGIYGYQQAWSPDTTAAVTVTDTQIGIVLNQAGPAGLTADQQRIAVQSLVWTATAAAQLTVPVRVEVTGGQRAFATIPAGTYSRPASTVSYNDLAAIWVDSPLPGATVSAPLTVTGQACVFEAQFSWQLLQGSAVVTSGSAMASNGCPSYGTYSIPLGSLAAGTYTLRAYEISMQDGSVAFETRVTFTVS
jgi:hypothetical protein